MEGTSAREALANSYLIREYEIPNKTVVAPKYTYKLTRHEMR